MWLFRDRRKHKRVKVNWQGVLRADFGEGRRELEVAVVDASPGGARLETPSLQMGSRHLLADHPHRLVLEILLPNGLFGTPITHHSSFPRPMHHDSRITDYWLLITHY